MKPTLTLITLLSLTACGGGGGDSTSNNPEGACAMAIADYEEANNIAPDPNVTASDYYIGNDNYQAFYIGVENGVVQSATFNWGADYDGCQASYD